MTNTENKSIIKELLNNKNIEVYYLTPQYDNAQSFYNKAVIEINNNIIYLFSYETLVLEIDRNNDIIKVSHNNEYLTNTTLRHIKETIKQYKKENINITKKELLNNYIELKEGEQTQC